MAKSRYRAWDRTLVPKLEGRAEALAGTFNAQNVANTLWAYATMGREPAALAHHCAPGAASAPSVLTCGGTHHCRVDNFGIPTDGS